MPLINPKCKANLTEIKLNGNVTVVNFPRVEWFFVENIWDLLGEFMTFTKT